MPKGHKQRTSEPIPGAFWDKFYKKIKKESPSYSDERVRATVGHIWWHQMGEAARQKYLSKAKKSFDDLASILVKIASDLCGCNSCGTKCGTELCKRCRRTLAHQVI